MTATRLDITIEQGADFDGPFPVDYDLTGYSAAMQIRPAPGYPTAIVSLSTAGGGLAIDVLPREVVASIPAGVTSAINPGRYAYDLVLTSPNGLVTRAFRGAACVSPGVTLITPNIEADLIFQDGSQFTLQDGSTLNLA